MLAKGGFAVKCWQFTGESSPCMGKMLSVNSDTVVATDGPVSTHMNMLKGTDSNLRVLGLGWNPVEHTVVFEVTLNFSKRKKGIHTGPNVKKADLPQGLPLVLTRRIVLSQVMMIFDPLGFVCPFTLLGKIYLRETCRSSLDGMISCQLLSIPSGFTSCVPCSSSNSSVWIVVYDHLTLLVDRGLSSSVMVVTSPMVLQPTSDGV